ncbi:enoyl-CoA hydratase/isomerase family protein [Ramlibacter rhizophilus]|uniref:Crotonase/enoyl-CoA hydratase family protein n=1 Tax=Ramlibacter rhizophilus TaxID=1781167 RepID=A0A4Z0BDM6_9BURK|nr:enoyl-CoA hydratase-related protein [Ramlibacter rhizophilus]TFY97406.1 crotonase/enoyl-CoA hydratase family protein [Ramlibacter rhizophilus]
MSLPLHYSKDGAIAQVVLDRPAARNALSPEMLCRLADAVVDFAADESLRVMVLTAAGEQAFCAGGDLARTIPLLSGERAPEDAWDERVLNDPVVMPASSLRDYPLHKPVIAAINGACFAAGFEIMLGTDIRIAAAHASFCLPEVKRAVIPFAGSMARLPRQVPYALAMELMLTGDPITAARAQSMGLVNEVLPGPEVLPRALDIARRIARNGPLAVQQLKRTVAECSGRPLEEAFRIEDETRRVVLASEDAREGPRAFMEKREPNYQGR